MICPALDQLTVDRGSTPLHPHSAPESRRSSWQSQQGEPASPGEGGRREEGGCGTFSSRAISLPDCSDSLPSPSPSPSSSSARPPRGSARSPTPSTSTASTSPRLSKSPRQEARQAFKDRSSSSPCPPHPTSPSSSSSSSPHSKRSFLRHHSSLDSAALASDFFGHLKPAPALPAGRSRPKIKRSQTTVQEEEEGQESMMASPLLRRPHEMTSSSCCVVGVPSLSPLFRSSRMGGGGKGGMIPPVYTTPPRRRLTITLPSSLPVSPVSARAQRTDPKSPVQGGGPQARSPSVESCGSSSGGEPSSPSSYFRVVVLGDVGVGKTTLIQQMTQVRGAAAGLPQGGQGQTNSEERDWLSQRVIITIDRHDQHCALEIFDNPLDANIDHLRPDAFIVIYSVSDRKSYLTAKEVTRHLRCELGMDRPIFLVGNKTDLRRQQRVASREARDVAEAYDCSVLETSAALRINVDSLFLHVLDSILRQLAPPPHGSQQPWARGKDARCRGGGGGGGDLKARGSSPGRAMRFVSKILRRAFLRRSVSSEAVGVCLH